MKEVMIDPTRCTACRTCELQCSIAHSKSKDLFKAIFEYPLPRYTVNIQFAPGINYPAKCMHCKHAPCIAACPTEAISLERERGIVLINDDRCIGCWMCAMVCPYGAIVPSYDYKVAFKCDGCIERLREGLEPACTAACPTKALSYKEIKDLARQEMLKSAKRAAEAERRGIETIGREKGGGEFHD